MKKSLIKNARVLFVNTRIETDIFVLFAFLPVWWILGIDQLIWPLITGWMLFKLLFSKPGGVFIDKTVKLMIIFLMLSLISAFFIDERYRLLTFVRNYSAFASVCFLFICLINVVNHENQVKKMMWALAIAAFFASFAGMMAIAEIYKPHFEAISKHLVPDSLKSYGMVRLLYSKATSTLDFFAGRMIVRPNSFFISCTSYGMALIAFLPVVCFLIVKSKGFRQIFLILTAFMLVTNLFFNITRGAILSLVMAVTIQIFRRFHRTSRYLIAAGVIFFASLFLYQPDYFLNTFNSIQKVLNLRGPGSQDSRMNIYRVSIEAVKARPVFGYGTQRDIPELDPFPAGSHSGYLGVLYRYGLAGLLSYVMILYSLYTKTRLPKTARKTGSFLETGIIFLGVVFFGNILHQFVEEPDLDLSVLHIVWLSFGLLLVSHRLLTRAQREDAIERK